MNLQELRLAVGAYDNCGKQLTPMQKVQTIEVISALEYIHRQLDGLEWNSGTAQAIANHLQMIGLTIREPGTVFDHRIARDEGWDMEAHNGVWNLVRVDEDVFDSDIDALIWVARGADGGSDFHRDALELIGKLVEV